MSAVADTGVARRRFNTPVSRCATTDITKLTNAAAMIPRPADATRPQRRDPVKAKTISAS
jgi:hypothetical protein